MKARHVILIVAVLLLAAESVFAQRTDQRDVRRAKKYLEEDPDYYARGDSPI